jgi:hypothetical protein
MSSQATLTAPRSRSRIQLRDRTHAAEIARGITFGPLFKNGGTVAGFADWLFVHRKTFNGPNPLQQAKVYVNGHRAAKKRGIDFDAACSASAEEKEHYQELARATFEANLAAIKAYWNDQQGGPGIVLAIAELSLGRGHRFTDAPDGKRLPEPPSCVLEGLLKLLEEFGGADDLLDLDDCGLVYSEDDLRRQISAWDTTMMTIRDVLLNSEPPWEMNFVPVACATKLLSCVPRVRIALRALLIQVVMAERIESTAPALKVASSAPARRCRAT